MISRNLAMAMSTLKETIALLAISPPDKAHASSHQQLSIYIPMVML